MDRFGTPILYIIFNRPDLVEITFARIREIKPVRLFIAADGPRAYRPEDVEKCKRTREVVLSMIDWECEVKTLFREENLGCGKAVFGALGWFFDHVEEGIIIEDDILIGESFPEFMTLALDRYRNENAVAGISGYSYPFKKSRGIPDTYFLPIGSSWGWATWKRVWVNVRFDPHSLIQELEDRNLIDSFNFGDHNFFPMLIDESKKRIDSWGIRFYASFFLKQQYFLYPRKSLIYNCGFDGSGTHSSTSDAFMNREIGEMKFSYAKVELRDSIVNVAMKLPKRRPNIYMKWARYIKRILS